jgi:type I restriction enzyme S subunit
MSEWTKKRLSSVVEIISGGTPKTDVVEYWNGDIYWLSVNDFPGDMRWVYTSEKTITENGLQNSATKLLNVGDIIVSARGTVGELSQIGTPMAFNQSCFGLRGKSGYDNGFIYYALKQQLRQLKSVANGAVFDTIILKTFDHIKISVTDLPSQTRITAILSAYDDAIEKNSRRIALLEKAAQELYREWFVRFRFPGYEETKFANGLPEGWAVKLLGEVLTVGRGSSPRPIMDSKYFDNGNIPWIKIADATKSTKFILKTKECVNEYGASFSRRLPIGSLIIAASGTLGFPVFLEIEGCIHDGWMYFDNISETTKEYLYFVLLSMGRYYNAVSYGAAIQNINTEIIRKSKIVIPSQDIIKRFTVIVSNTDCLMKNLQKQSQNFARQRDLLLPRLMSGKFEV